MSTAESPASAGRRRAAACDAVGIRDRLTDGAFGTLRARGIAGTSARTMAAEAGVNQMLIFHHFGRGWTA